MLNCVAAILTLFLVSPLVVAQTNSGKQVDLPRPYSQLQVQRALQISKLAAQNGMQELSLRAVSEALAGGPPIQIRAAPPTMAFGTGASFSLSTTTRPQPTTAGKSAVEMIQKELKALDEVWYTQKFQPEAVYRALVNVVLPPGRPDEVFFYEQTISAAALNSQKVTQPFNLGRLLTEWAQRANTIDELHKRLDALKQQKQSRISATILQSMLDMQTEDVDGLKQHLGELRIYLVEMSTGKDAEVAAQLAFPLLGSPRVGPEAVAIVEKVLDQIVAGSTTNRNYHVEPATSILKTIANTYRRVGNTEKVRETVSRMLNVNSVYNNRYNNSSNNYVQRLRQAQISTATSIYIDAGMFADAAPLMAEYYELQSITGRTFGQDYGARLFRSMVLMDASERFRLLHSLCIPKNAAGVVNLQSCFAPRLKPLPVFASTVPDSTTNHKVFDLPTTGICRDVMNSGEYLVRTAKEAGHLDKLLTEMQQPAAKGVDILLFFAQFESGSADYKQLADILIQRTQSLAQLKQSAEISARLNKLDDYVLAVRAAEAAELREPALELMEAIHQKSKDTQNATVRVHVRRAMELTKLLLADADPAILEFHNLKYWSTAECDTNVTHARGDMDSSWVTLNGYLQGLTSSEHGLLFFRYPLMGDFEVEAVVTEGNWSEGGFVYDGMLSNSYAYGQSVSLRHIGRPSAKAPKLNLMVGGQTPSHVKLEVHDQTALFRVNGHPAHTDDVTGSSPFLAIRGAAGWTPGLRGLKITGNPQIPREVQLLRDHRLRGWMSFYSEKLSSPFAATATTETFDWTYSDGILRARQDSGAGSSESLLVYQRPLQSGETLSWEFEYRKDRVNAHPALGRLAFLLEPDGVHLHWVTDAQQEWSGVPEDNSVTEASSRRGPDKLPLQDGAWNKIELSLKGRTVRLTLNGQLVMERTHEDDLQTQFGLFHPRSEGLRVRNLVLTGNWPDSIQAAVPDGLLALDNTEQSASDRHAISAAIGLEKFSLMGYQLSRDSESLPAEQRLNILKSWVLPGDDTPNYRVRGGFVPSYRETDTGQTSQSVTPAIGSRQPGALVSPALDMVVAATELGQLQELKRDITAATQKYRTELAVRTQNAILSAIATAENDFAAANSLLEAVLADVKANPHKPDHLRWAEMLAGWNAIQFPETLDAGLRLLDFMVMHQINQGVTTGWKFDNPVRSMRGLGHERWNLAHKLARPLDADSRWQPVTHARADTSAMGIGESRWTQNIYGGVTHYCGHEKDFLYYGVPLLGDFTVECDVTSFDWRETRLMYADHWVGINYTRNHFEHGRTGFDLPTKQFTEDPLPTGQWLRCKMEVKDGVCSHWVNGTKIFEETLQDPDPWLAIRCGMNINGGSVRNLKITGHPTIPTQLQLTKQPWLHGWIATHFQQPRRSKGADWTRGGSYIVGTKRTAMAITNKEGLLQYHRPLLEDAEIEYDFSYAEDSRLVHPAIGRLAFLLEADGVAEHIITNGIYETEGLLPDNRTVITGNRLSGGPLPLQAGDNHVKLTLTGDQVVLNLNGADIYRRELLTQDQRFFGFFHYPGKTEARIRNVIYRGNWGRTLPSVSDQQLAGDASRIDLQIDTDDPKQSVIHNFATSGLPEELFPSSINRRDDKTFSVTKDGVRVSHAGSGGWNSKTLSPQLAIVGDFDLTASFSDFSAQTPDADKLTGIQLGVSFVNQPQDSVEVIRRLRPDGQHIVESMRVDRKSGSPNYESTYQPESSTSGRLRLSRRGRIVLWMYAPEDSEHFRILRTEAVTDAPVELHSIDIEAQVGGQGGVDAVWKNFSIRADKILDSAPPLD